MKSNTQGGMLQPTGLGQSELRQVNTFLEKKPCSRLQRAEKQNNRVTGYVKIAIENGHL